MRPLTTGVASGSSLAVVWKALQILDRPDPLAACSALHSFEPSSNSIDWFSFTLGLITGILIYCFLEFVLTLRLAISEWVSARRSKGQQRGKPLYRII